MRWFAWIPLITLAAVVAFAAPRVNGKDVIAMVERSLDAVNDYRVDASLSVKATQLNIKDMRVIVYYKKPNKVHVEASQGFALVPTGNFFGNPMKELTRYAQPVYLKCETKNGRPCHVVRLDPKRAGGMPGMTVWVDARRNVVIATRSRGRQQLRTNWTYRKVSGKYYLPSRIDADFEIPRSQGGAEKAEASITFSDYRVNRGISDKVFEDKRGK